MIDKLFSVVLVFNATGLFRFLAPQVGVSIGQISLAFLGLNVFYLIAKARYSKAIFRKNSTISWLFILLLWPLLTIGYAPSFEVRELGLQLYSYTLFLGAVVYTIANGLPAMQRVLFASLIVTIIGIPLSLITPQYFVAVADLANASVEVMGRPVGFFLQPNSLAMGAAFLFVGWFALRRRRKFLHEVFAILAFMIVMLLTGSRTGMLVSIIVGTLIQVFSWKKKIASSGLLLKICVLIGCLAGGVLGMRYYVASMENSVGHRQQSDAINRMDTMLSFRLSSDGGVKDDASVKMRLLAQMTYLSLLYEKPLLGHGFGADAHYREKGRIFLAAHSEALTCAMEYGVLYPAIFCLLMLQLYRNRNRRDVESIFRTNSIGQFVFVVIFLFSINGGLFDSRTFYVIFGMFFAAVNCPQYVFCYDEKTRRIAGILTRREIAGHSVASRGLWKASQTSISAESGMTPGGGAYG